MEVTISPTALRRVMTAPEFVSDSPPVEAFRIGEPPKVGLVVSGEPPPKMTIAVPAGIRVLGAKRWRTVLVVLVSERVWSW